MTGSRLQQSYECLRTVVYNNFDAVKLSPCRKKMPSILLSNKNFEESRETNQLAIETIRETFTVSSVTTPFYAPLLKATFPILSTLPPLYLSSKQPTFHNIFRQYCPIEIREKHKNNRI